jgi:6-phosphogluconolactonase
VGPRDFTIDPSGVLLLVANQDTDTVVTFWIDPDAGTLQATGHVAAVPTPVCLRLYAEPEFPDGHTASDFGSSSK